HLLQGQPAEGRPGRGAVPRCRAVHHGRAHLGPGPADGGDLHRRGRAPARGRPHRAALEPHPRRGREALRHRHHHPRGEGRGDRDPGRAAPPHPLHRRREHRRRPGPARSSRRGARPRGRARTRALRHRRQRPPRGAPATHRDGCHRTHDHPALARGPVPAPLRRRARPGRALRGGDVMNTTAPARPAGRGAAAAPTHRRERETASPLAGTGSLVRLYGRLSRRAIIVWSLALLALVPASILAMEEAYPDQQVLAARAMLLDNPSAVMMPGPFFATDRYTFWSMVANELMLYVLLAAAIMSVLLSVRHTRTEEETGRLEMTRALATGRLAPSVAAFTIVTIANLAVGAAVAGGALIVGGPVADSLAMGLATALTGLVLAAIAAVTAQVTEHAGSASGMALGLLALAVVVRGIGDVMDRQGSWLSWLSPIAWAQQTRLYVDLRWWPLLVSLGAVAALLVLAGALSRRRDVGAGLRPASA